MPASLKKTLVLFVAVTAAAGFLTVLLQLVLRVHSEGLPIRVGPLVVAALAYGVYRVLNAGVWSLVLRALGAPVGPLKGARIWLVAESARWCPGSLWGYAARAALAVRKEIDGSIVAASLVLELMLTMLAWLAAACVGLATLDSLPALSEVIPELPPEVPLAALVPAAGVAVLGLLYLAARRSRRVRSFVARLTSLRRVRIAPGRAVLAWLAYFVLCLVHGVTFWLILRSLGLDAPIGAAVAANAVAWVVGFLAFFAPGGIGVREAAVAVLLAPWTGFAGAAFAAVLWRLVQVVVEPAVLAPIAFRSLTDPASRVWAHTRKV